MDKGGDGFRLHIAILQEMVDTGVNCYNRVKGAWMWIVSSCKRIRDGMQVSGFISAITGLKVEELVGLGRKKAFRLWEPKAFYLDRQENAV